MGMAEFYSVVAGQVSGALRGRDNVVASQSIFGGGEGNLLQVLEEVDTQDVTPTSHSVDLNSVMRDDEVTACLDVEHVLANAPRREGDYFKVNVVLEE